MFQYRLKREWLLVFVFWRVFSECFLFSKKTSKKILTQLSHAWNFRQIMHTWYRHWYQYFQEDGYGLWIYWTPPLFATNPVKGLHNASLTLTCPFHLAEQCACGGVMAREDLITGGYQIPPDQIIPDICHFFSTEPIFGSIFLHTKMRKSRQNRFSDKSA